METAWNKRNFLWVLVGILAFVMSLAGGYLVATRLEDEDGRKTQVVESIPTQVKDNNESDVWVDTGSRPRDAQVGECEFWQENRNEWTVAGAVQAVKQEGEWYKLSLNGCEVDTQVEAWLPADLPLAQYGYATDDGLVWENLTPAEIVALLTEGKKVAVTAKMFASEADWINKNFEKWTLSRDECMEMAVCGSYLKFREQQEEMVRALDVRLQAGKSGMGNEEVVVYSTAIFSLDDWDQLVRLKTEGGL